MYGYLISVTITIQQAFPSAIATASSAFCNDDAIVLDGTGVPGGAALITKLQLGRAIRIYIKS